MSWGSALQYVSSMNFSRFSQDETSEMFIGEWAESRGIRDQLVIATKVRLRLTCWCITSDCAGLPQFTNAYKKHAPLHVKINYSGNSIKAMNISLDESLRKLRTHYVDIFYVHQWDFTASVEEVMNGLHNLVVSGKVLYLVRLSVRPRLDGIV